MVKRVLTTEFLKKYSSLVNENKNSFEFLFLPPGTIEYFKSISSKTFVIHTSFDRSFYNLDEGVDDYLLIMKTNINGDVILNFKCYSTQGHFNKYISSFKEIYCNEMLSVNAVDEMDAALKCINYIRENVKETARFKVKYKSISKEV